MKRGFAYLSLVVFITLGILTYKERRAFHLLKSLHAIREDVSEVVVRHYLHGITGMAGERGVIFLSFVEAEKDYDPSDDFIARFRDLPIEISKVSSHVKDEYGAVKDKQGHSGMIIRLYDVGKQGFFKRAVPVTFYSWGWGQEGHLFHLELT